MKKVFGIVLSVAILLSCVPVVLTDAADSVIEICNGESEIITEKIYLQEYRTYNLQALVPIINDDGTVSVQAPPADTSVCWESNLPLLANVDETGKVTAYDFSKRAVIQLWIDENIKTIPIVGESTANAIWNVLDSSGIDLDNTDTDTIVSIVSTVAGEQLGESLRTYLDNMNVEITATLYDEQGNVLGSDTVEFVIEKSLVASVAPTGVHITNKKNVPTIVAVGATVQLYGVCTPVRLNQGVKWVVETGLVDATSNEYASVSETGLVTFLSPGTVTIKLLPQSTIYGLFSDTITFTVLDKSQLPVESFSISGETSVSEGGKIQLSVVDVVPAGAYQGDLVWSSDNTSVAVVDESGVVTGLDGGTGLTYSKTVNITATMGGISKEVEIKVTRPIIANISSVEITGDSAIGIGNSSSYTATVFPERLNNSSSVSREWGYVDAATGEYVSAKNVSVENAVARVSPDGTVTALGSGVITIYCKAEYNSSSIVSTFSIVCGKAITDFVITGSTSIKECERSQLGISVVAPADYEPSLLDSVVWTVSDDSVATVNENGVLLGRDAGGRSGSSNKTTVVTATVSGVSRSITITVTGQGLIAINKYSDGEIDGNDCVIVDLPRQYSIKTYPERINQTSTYWGIQTNGGGAPWSASQTYDGNNRNVENDIAKISDDGIVSGKKAGNTVIYGYAKNLLSTYIEVKREIDVIEIVPVSITLKEPDKTTYIEGTTQLDLSGMEVYLNYSREEVSKYYPDADEYTDAQLTAQVTDFTVSELNTNALDMQQYIIVSVTRAGKTMNAVFPVIIESKKVESLTVTHDKAFYMEDEEIDFSSLKVVANYLNTESEEITDYIIDETSYSKTLYDVEQNVRVTYTHAGREVEAFFPITIYGYPVVTVESNGELNQWNSDTVCFTLSSTHIVDGVTFYYRYRNASNWITISSNECYFFENQTQDICFRAVNSVGIQSKETDFYSVKIDKVSPEFTLTKENSNITNQDYDIYVDTTQIGISGIKTLTVNGVEADIEKMSFTVSSNGEYRVVMTAGNNLTFEKTIIVDNIDKQVPAVTGITLSQADEYAPSRKEEGEFGLYYSDDVIATVDAEDSGVAGVDYLEYRIVDESYQPVSQWTKIMQNETGVCTVQFKGYFEFVAVDKAGNRSSSLYSDGFTRDSVKPVILTVNPTCNGKEYTNDVWADDVVEFTPQADAFSGVYEIQYNINGGEFRKLETETIQVLENGTSVYGFKAISYSGLESDVYEYTVKIDREAPFIRVDFEGTFGRWTNEPVKFTLGTLTECPSGCTYYYDCGNGWVELESNVAVFTESTNAYYRFKAVNGAGLESAPSDSYLVMIDNVTPNAQIVYGNTEKTDMPYSINVMPITGEAGTLKVYFDGQDITDTLSFTVKENGRYMITIIGNNMLSNTIAVEVNNFSNYPTSSFTYEVIDDKSIKITGINTQVKNVTIPFEIDGYRVVEIGDNAFNGNCNIESVNVAVTVEKIGANAFANCSSLQKVILCREITAFSENVFENSDNVVVYCYASSVAKDYVDEYGLMYELLDIEPVGTTLINDVADIIITQQTCKTNVSEIISAEGYNVITVPSYMVGEVQYLGTGSIFYLFEDGRLAATYTLVLLGDVNGDSVVNAIDITLVYRAKEEKIVLNDAYFLAADINNDGVIDDADYQQILYYAVR